MHTDSRDIVAGAVATVVVVVDSTLLELIGTSGSEALCLAELRVYGLPDSDMIALAEST